MMEEWMLIETCQFAQPMMINSDRVWLNMVKKNGWWWFHQVISKKEKQILCTKFNTLGLLKFNAVINKIPQ